jgi:hypothetical protein
MVLGFTDGDGMPFLEDLVDGDQGFECLDLVGQDRLPSEISHRSTIPGNPRAYTFMLAQKAFEDLWSHV